MGVFRNENAAARTFRDTQQQGKYSKLYRYRRRHSTIQPFNKNGTMGALLNLTP